MTTLVTVQPSAYGWSAYFPNGRAIAHSKDLELLHAYLADCRGLERAAADMPVHEGGDRVDAGPRDRGVGASRVPKAKPRNAPRARAEDPAVAAALEELL